MAWQDGHSLVSGVSQTHGELVVTNPAHLHPWPWKCLKVCCQSRRGRDAEGCLDGTLNSCLHEVGVHRCCLGKSMLSIRACLLSAVAGSRSRGRDGGTEIRLTVMHRRRSEKAPHMVNLDTMPMDSFKQDKRYPLYTGIFTQASSGKKQNSRECIAVVPFIAGSSQILQQAMA